MLISWFHYAKNNENTQIPRKKSIINSYIKGKVVIKLWKKNMKSQKSLWQPNMQVFSFKDSEGFSLLKKKKDENMFISLPKIRMTNGWHGKERQKHHLTIPIHGKFSLVLQWISHTLYIFGNIYIYNVNWKSWESCCEKRFRDGLGDAYLLVDLGISYYPATSYLRRDYELFILEMIIKLCSPRKNKG